MNEGNFDDEKRVDLGGIFYDEDGEFKPLTASHGNISGYVAYLRDTYMKAERDYFEQLLADSEVSNYFTTLMDEGYTTADTLYDEAMTIMGKIETGQLEDEEDNAKMQSMSSEERDEYHMQKLEKAEGIVCLLLAAIRDKVRIEELVLTYHGGRGGISR